MTQAKRIRERELQMKRQDKEEKRVQRKAEAEDRPVFVEGEDPDLVGLKLGPQAPLF
ncbi:MAG: hypothetical protein O7F12_05470 [Nitrospirae bacterium]|nr:hypothetical protein [Nitrospirota bacterium]